MWCAEPEKFRADQLAALVTEVTGGELHIAIAPSLVWLDDAEAAAARAELARIVARYAGVPDDPDEPTFTEIAGLLTSPPTARYGWLADPNTGARLGVLTAATDWFGLVAVREEDNVYLRTFDDEALSRVLAAVLPQWWKPGEQPISVLRSELVAAAEETVGAVTPGPHVRRAQRLAALPARIIAEFYAEAADPEGRRRTCREPLRVYDTEDGRWAMRVIPLPGDERVLLFPADEDDIVRELDELFLELD
ncbi:EspG family protein [Amycolatopsis marina]|uniref:EspG family protein n=1 Tax=Amycolatopsis marina TaxID=490629 RepID=A0A1I0XN95_9PSEU|nr:ESX secretion-associated protein EspG [Amycolatopsis marina]SFB02525.1 EspG family protein [Amycolatopsis marina]